MGVSYDNPASAIDYANKDFVSIFQNELELVKQLTYKWDPESSNESDPGVLLLKLNAFLGDKDSYNTDKNILEAFPETMSQEFSARSNYKQLGYHMPWYIAAKTKITLKWVGPQLDGNRDSKYIIPKYTMVCDHDNQYIFTTLNSIQFQPTVTTQTVDVIQGVLNTLTIAGNSIITSSNLDNNNRIYFPDRNVAENGIFITSLGTGSELTNQWKQVDNLQIQPDGEAVYEFGQDLRTDACYLQFPDDFYSIASGGIQIDYVVTKGSEGTVPAGVIDSFYTQKSTKVWVIDDSGESVEMDIPLTSEYIEVFNASASTYGLDPETIEEGYKSYKKTVGTFDTLVTLRDYTNALYNSGYLSNVIVSDRYSDIHSTNKIVTENGTNIDIVKKVQTGIDTVPEMSAYDLKLYVLDTAGEVETIDDYNKSFNLVTNKKSILEQFLEDKKCVSHDYKDIAKRFPCLFRNVYSLQVHLTCKGTLTEVQKEQVKANVLKSIQKETNSRMMEFGEEPNYSKIYTAILNSDSRIAYAVLDDFTYSTYAAYIEDDTYIEGADLVKYIPICYRNDPYVIECASLEDITTKIQEFPSEDWSRYYFVVPATDPTNNTKIYRFKEDATDHVFLYSNRYDLFRECVVAKNVLSGVTPLYTQTDNLPFNINEVVDEGFPSSSKNIATDLVISPFGFEKGDDEHIAVDEDTHLPLPVQVSDLTTTEAIYNLKKNESIQLLAPSLRTSMSYSNGIKYQLFTEETSIFSNKSEVKYSDYSSRSISRGNNYYIQRVQYEANGYNSLFGSTLEQQGEFYVLKYSDLQYIAVDWDIGAVQVYQDLRGTVDSNEDYELKSNEKIVFFWKDEDGEESPYRYRIYRGKEQGSDAPSVIIKPSFILHPSTPGEYIDPEGSILTKEAGYIEYGTDTFKKVSDILGENVLTGTRSIDIRELDKTVLKKDSSIIYFVTKQESESNDKYILNFTQDQLDSRKWTRTLETGEQLLYTDSSGLSYEVLGIGTLLVIESDTDIQLSVDKISLSEIYVQGVSAFLNKGIQIKHDIVCYQQQIYNLVGEDEGKGDSILVALDSNYRESQEGVYYREAVDEDEDGSDGYFDEGRFRAADNGSYRREESYELVEVGPDNSTDTPRFSAVKSRLTVKNSSYTLINDDQTNYAKDTFYVKSEGTEDEYQLVTDDDKPVDFPTKYYTRTNIFSNIHQGAKYHDDTFYELIDGVYVIVHTESTTDPGLAPADWPMDDFYYREFTPHRLDGAEFSNTSPSGGRVNTPIYRFLPPGETYSYIGQNGSTVTLTSVAGFYTQLETMPKDYLSDENPWWEDNDDGGFFIAPSESPNYVRITNNAYSWPVQSVEGVNIRTDKAADTQYAYYTYDSTLQAYIPVKLTGQDSEKYFNIRGLNIDNFPGIHPTESKYFYRNYTLITDEGLAWEANKYFIFDENTAGYYKLLSNKPTNWPLGDNNVQFYKAPYEPISMTSVYASGNYFELKDDGSYEVVDDEDAPGDFPTQYFVFNSAWSDVVSGEQYQPSTYYRYLASSNAYQLVTNQDVPTDFVSQGSYVRSNEYSPLAVNSSFVSTEHYFMHQVRYFEILTGDSYSGQRYEDVSIGVDISGNQKRLISVSRFPEKIQGKVELVDAVYYKKTGENTYTQIDRADILGRAPAFFTTKTTPVRDFSVEYRIGASGAYQKLPRLTVEDTSLLWQGTAILNLNVSKETPQYIFNSDDSKSVQKLEVGDNVIGGVITSNTGNTSRYVRCDTPLNLVGGTRIDTGILRLSGSEEYPSFLSYENKEPDVTSFDITRKYVEITQEVDSSSSASVEFDCNIDAPILFRVEKLSNFTLVITATTDVTIDPDEPPEVEPINYESGDEPRFLYYKVVPESLESGATRVICLTFTVRDPDTDEASFRIYQFAKYQFNPELVNEGIDESSLLGTMQDFTGSLDFIYDYIVPENVLVLNPLEPKSFFNPNHFANKYTIAMGQLPPVSSLSNIPEAKLRGTRITVED